MSVEEEMTDTEDWRQIHREQADRREAYRQKNTAAILELAQHGYRILSLTQFQYRINGALDLFPTNRKYHHIPTKKRGSYRSETALDLCRRILRTP